MQQINQFPSEGICIGCGDVEKHTLHTWSNPMSIQPGHVMYQSILRFILWPRHPPHSPDHSAILRGRHLVLANCKWGNQISQLLRHRVLQMYKRLKPIRQSLALFK